LVAHVRQIEPNWQPTWTWTSTTTPVEAQIRFHEIRAQEARDRLIELANSGALPILRGPRSPLHRAIEDAAIEAYRDKEGLFDLFRHPQGVVAIGVIDGQHYFGVNSTSPAYTSKDRAGAMDMRDRIVRDDPYLRMQAERGERPTDAFFHAEVTLLLRAAKKNGDTLVGRTVELFVDEMFCNNCRQILPKVALELGNPTVIVRDRIGREITIRDGISLRGR
jgi:hypothetical protein